MASTTGFGGSRPDPMDNIIRDKSTHAGGRITLAQFMELALYHPEFGYYLAPDRKPGRGGDFLTSPEASPLFGITIARQIVECWERMDRPPGFSIREYGSGVGGLAYDILAGIAERSPDLFAGIEYRLVERNRHRQAEALTAFRDAGLIEKVIDESDVSLEPITGMVLANEVADAFPAHRLVYQSGTWSELWVVAGDAGFRFEPDRSPRTASARSRALSPAVLNRWRMASMTSHPRRAIGSPEPAATSRGGTPW